MRRKIIYEKAIHLLNESNTLALSVVDENNYPNIYPMEKVISVNLNIVISERFCIFTMKPTTVHI
ncbi:hypothetical protein UT300005_01910 [Clostridium sp. CTA-5]